ncbi:hypothetical protein SAMN02927914_04653 [Mesorhizobium qingshengii]|uniref:Uncharacterized protein n=1 Tax=Mesorhizobium qingshengii TaxID=1165689 RepID=A0A1G5ZC85_9HYPH|nr:hypothetical protein SAMN02927914_04653 [Mesorhizobium qingshengii]
MRWSLQALLWFPADFCKTCQKISKCFCIGMEKHFVANFVFAKFLGNACFGVGLSTRDEQRSTLEGHVLQRTTGLDSARH